MRDRALGEMFGLDGQVAIVTGALGRLGREYVRTLAAAGARVGAIDIAGDRSVFGSLAGVHVELADLSKKDETDRAIGEIVRALGAPSILVNNAGMGSSPATAGNENGPFEDYSEAAWDTMIDSHLKTTLFATQAFIRHFRAAKLAGGPPSLGSGGQAASSTCRPPTASSRPINRSTTTSAPAARRSSSRWATRSRSRAR